ncbi:glycosyl hydrolase [Streptomyces sp. V4-01]|uniref:Glycosyl hydrolase n=1 Tax=Actinacidiphila polyblastidii TaxID=3110430 RepID=A0ABU7P8Y3_9ACTN|nr:glycosyl hydrolase [Streptomyces sp. V4-01]
MVSPAPHPRRLLRLLVAGLLAVPAAAALTPGSAHADTPSATVYQAEDGALNGVSVGTSVSGYQGAGYAEGFDESGDTLTITVPDSPGGLYALSVRYDGPYGDKKANLLVNGSGVGEVSLPASATWTDAAAGDVLLKAGANTVTVSDDWGWYLIDSISLTPAPARPPHAVTGRLTDPQATPEARSLMTYLAANYGKDILSGQQDSAHEQWLEANVGKAPAIEGLDMMDYSPSRVERGTVGTDTDNALAWDRRGGITAFVWHWNAPTDLIDQPGEEWWRGFYTDATTFDVQAALADPASADYQLLLRDIDAIAVQLRRLQDAGVPVLWRPLHEAEGGWFWWGAKGPGPAKALYRLMHDRLTRVDGIHNLIWEWNSVDPAWYPGDDVVDLVSADSYPTAGDHGPVALTYDRELSLTGDTKVAALSEVGTVPDPDLLRAYQADWSYFVTWGGFEQDAASNSLDFLKRVYGDPYVITLDELGDFKHSAGGSGACTASYRTTSDWGNGFTVDVTVKAGARALTGWKVTWTFAGNQKVTNAWNAAATQSGAAVTATNMGYNGSLPAAGTTSFGFQGAYSGTNQAPTLTCTMS